jgi:hypothetical protein
MFFKEVIEMGDLRNAERRFTVADQEYKINKSSDWVLYKQFNNNCPTML